MPKLLYLLVCIAGVIATVFRSRIPGLKIPPFPLLMIPFLLATSACSAHN
jgi:hypothetical protein